MIKSIYDHFKIQSGQYLPDHSWGSTLPDQRSPGLYGHRGNANPVPTDGLTEDSVPTEDFQGLQMEVSACAEVLENFSKMLCGQLLGVLGQVLRNQQVLPALQALEESVSKLSGTGRVGERGGACPRPSRLTAPSPKLEQGQQFGRVEPLSGPAGAILECLVLPGRTVVKELAGPIFYLLEALAGEGPGAGQVGGRDVGLPSWAFPSPSHPRSLPSTE